jgi:ribosomal protein S18 acetylase RimI-like enzyme
MRRALQELLIAGDPNILRLSEDRMAESARFYAEIMSRPEARIIVAANRDDVPVGMLMLRVMNNPMTDPDRFGRIDDAWVDTEHRRKGLMRGMVQVGAEMLTAQGISHIMLDYSVHNPVGEQCWRALGFNPMLVIAMARIDRLKLKPVEA